MSNSPVLPWGWRLESLSQFSGGDVGSRIPELGGLEDSGAGDPGSWPLAPGRPALPKSAGLASVLTSFPFWLLLSERADVGGSGKGGRAREPGGGEYKGVRKSRGGDSVGGWRRTGTAARDPRTAPTPSEQAPPWPNPANSTRPCSGGPCGCFGTRAPPGESC